MAKNNKPDKPAPQEKREWTVFKKSMVHYWDTLTDTYHELRRESDLFNELVLYIPFVCAMLFFYYTNRIAYFYHNFGNYGLEENFIATTVPIIKDLFIGNFSRLSLGLDGPLYPFLLAVKGLVFGQVDLLKSALFLNVIFGTLALLTSYYLIKTVFNLKTAVISLILIATNTAYFEYTYTAGAGTLFFFLIVLSLFLLFRNHRDFSTRSAVLLFLSGAAGGFAALTNITGLLLLAFGPIAVYLFDIAGRDEKIKLKTSLAFVLGFLSVFLTAALLIKLKAAIFITPLPLMEKAQGGLLLAHLKNLYFRLFADIGELIGWTIGAFVTLGILVMVLSENTRPQLAFMSLGILVFIGLAFLQHNRFNAFILLLFFVPLAANIFGSGVYKRILDRRVAVGLFVVFLALLCVSVFRNLNRIGDMAQGEPKHLIAIARYFREHPEEKGSIISERPLLPKRLSMEHIPLDPKIEDMAGLLKYAYEKKAKYLLADFPEYNACGYLRFLSLPQMKNPLHLKEIIRKDYSALYAFDFSGLDKISAPRYTAEPVRAFLQGGAKALPRRASPDSIAAFITASFRVKDLSRLRTPAYQMVSRYNMKGYTLFGALVRGIFDEIITVNMYAPEVPQQTLRSAQRPSILILAGDDKEGKGAILPRNLAENLVRSGCFVIVMDAPGTGERIGPYASLSNFMLYQAASGYSPAELFISEALLVRNLFGNLPQARNDEVHLVGVGDDAYTALYTALLDTTVKSVTFVGGLVPFGDMALQNYRPVKALIPGLAGRFSFGALLTAVKERARNVQCISVNTLLNPVFGSYAADYGFRVFPIKNEQDFVKETFAKGIESLCAYGDSAGAPPAPVQFRGFNDQEKAVIGTIGDQAVTSNSPPLFDIFQRPETLSEDPDSGINAGNEPLIIRGMVALPATGGMERKKMTLIDKSGLPVEWIESKAKGSKPDRLLAVIDALDSANADTALTQAAMEAGYTLCRVSLLPSVSGYPDALSAYYDNLLFGLSSRDRVRSALRIMRNYYHAVPVLLCADSLTLEAGLCLAGRDSTLVKRVILKNFTGGRPDALLGDIYAGYDGNPYAAGEYVNLNNLLVSLVIRNFGDAQGDDLVDIAASKKVPVALYYPVADDAPSAETYADRAKIFTSASGLFSGK